MGLSGRWVFLLAAAIAACTSGGDGSASKTCERSTDCVGGVCDPASGTCADCLRDSDCGARATCRSRSCVEHAACANSLDCPHDQVCDQEQRFCVECLQDGDCAESAGCVDQRCRPRCESDKDCVELGMLCDFGRSLCVECIGDSECSDNDFCADGVCKPDVCAAGLSACDALGIGLRTCSDNGSEERLDPCAADSVCTTKDGRARCMPRLCEPATTYCDPTARYVQHCSDDGLSAENQTDCNSEGRTCIGGICQDAPCEKGERYCQGATVFECNSAGTFASAIESCGSGWYCDPDAAACVAGSCIPGKKLCAQQGLITCNAEGTGYDATPCSVDQVCVEAACLPKLCEPETLFCKDGNPQQCNSHGTEATTQDNCDSDEYCEPGYSTCRADVCSPSALGCLDNSRGTCNPDGSTYVDLTPCGDEICVNGACHPKVCEPNYEFCTGAGEFVEKCNAHGTDSSITEDCHSQSALCEELGAGQADCGSAGQGGVYGG